MLLEGMLWQDLKIALALNLEKVIVASLIQSKLSKKIQCGSEGMMASLRDLS